MVIRQIIQQIIDDVHYNVEVMESYGMMDDPVFPHLKEFASDLIAYESVRCSPEGDSYIGALLERLISIVDGIDPALWRESQRSQMIAFLFDDVNNLRNHMEGRRLSPAPSN